MHVLIHAKMYALADLYSAQGLKTVAEEKFATATGDRNKWNCKEFVETVEIAYSSTPDRDCGLRDVICIVLSRQSNLTQEPEIDKALEGIPCLARDLLKLKLI